MSATIHVPDVCERDIDLMLLEEFVASEAFRSWFLSQIGGESTAGLTEARRSVKTETGESNLELTFLKSSGSLKILIENKVDAAFQPNQPQRYLERAAKYRNGGNYGEVVTVVIAPKVYFGEDDEKYGFDARVTYESVLLWFSNNEHASPRTDSLLSG